MWVNILKIASLKAQLAEAKYNLEQTIVRAPSDGYVTQVLIRPGTYAASLPLRPVMVFIPDQKRQIVAQFRQELLAATAPGDDAEVVFNALPGKVFSGKLAAITSSRSRRSLSVDRHLTDVKHSAGFRWRYRDH